MTDVSGIPNMGFGGGGYFGGSPNQQPAMSAGQINQAMWGNYSPQQAQSVIDNLYPGGFGSQTAYYAALAAAYGRATGGYGGYGGQNDPLTPVTDEQRAAAYARNPALMGPGAAPAGGGGDPNAARAAAYASNPALMGPSVFDTGTTPFNDYDGGANPGNFSPGPIPPINAPVGGVFDPNAERAAAYARNPALMGPAAPFNNYNGGANPGNFSPNPTNSTPPPVQAQLPPSSPPQGFDPNAERAAAYARNPALMGPGGVSSHPQGAQPSAQSAPFDPDAARAAAYAANPSLRGPAMGSTFDQSTYTPNPYAGMILGPQGNPEYFNPGAYAGDQGNYGIPYQGARLPGDIGFNGQQQTPNLGYNPGMQNWFAPQQGPNAYAPLGGALQYPNSGSPSQYDPSGQMPPGFAGEYSFDNQGGYLPFGATGGYQPGG